MRVKDKKLSFSLSDSEAQAGESRVRVAICIGTFRRCELLRHALAGLDRLTFRKVAAPEIEIIVVDNDPSGSAKEICEMEAIPYPIRHVVEPRRGIAHVRNRALTEAGDAAFVAFLDDDEVPSEAWLDELLATQARSGADVVSGPVLPSYAPGVEDWVKRGGFFARPNYETGSTLEFCSTNNALICLEVFSRVPRSTIDFNSQVVKTHNFSFACGAPAAGPFVERSDRSRDSSERTSDVRMDFASRIPERK